MHRTSLWLAGIVVFVGGCGSSSNKGGLTATGAPTGEVSDDLVITVDFSKPMVRSTQFGTHLEKSPITIAPAIAGQTWWEDDTKLNFKASETLKGSREYTVTVPQSLRALDGSTLAKAYTFQFTSERLSGEAEVIGSYERARQKQAVKLSFNQNVNFEEINDHCHFTSTPEGSTKAEKVTVTKPADSPGGIAKSHTVIPTTELALSTTWTLHCAEALRGTEGELTMVGTIEDEFTTHGPLKALGISAVEDVVPAEDLRIDLEFSNPLQKPYYISINPPVPGFPGQCHIGGSDPPNLSCAALLDAQTAYTVTIEAKQMDIFGQQLGAEKTFSFRTVEPDPTISMESGFFVAETTRPVFPIWTRNVTKLEVTALALTPKTYEKFRPHLDWWESSPIDLSDTSLKPTTKKLALTGTKNQWSQQPLDPVTFFGGKPGPGMYYFEVVAPEVEDYEYERKKVLINFTDIGVVSKIGATQGIVWVTKLSSGDPLPGAEVVIHNASGKKTWSGKTNKNGIAKIPGRKELEKKPEEDINTYDRMNIFVSYKKDWTILNANRTGGLDAYNFNISSDSDMSPVKLRGFMHTDRGLYRPGETVHIKGLARTTRVGQPLAVPKSDKVSLEVKGPRGDIVKKMEASLSKFGGFWTDIELPEDSRLGDYTIRARLEHGTFRARFSVEEYRPATFEVTQKTRAKFVTTGGSLDATISANYLYGAPVRDGQVELAVHSRPRHPQFRDFKEFQFYRDRDYGGEGYASGEQMLVTEEQSGLDNDGNASFSISISPEDVATDADILVRANVTTPADEVISKSFVIPYYRSDRYHGIKASDYFLEIKKQYIFHLVAVNPEGKSVGGKAKLSIRRQDWNCIWEDWGYRGSYRCNEDNEDIVSETIELDKNKPIPYEFKPEKGGEYWITLAGEKGEGTASLQMYAWGDGGGSWRSDDSMTYNIITDKKEYQVGDTATLLLKTDLTKAKGLISIERDGVIETRLMDLEQSGKYVKVPILANYAPNIYVSVALVQGRTGKGIRGKPRMRMGLVNLRVNADEAKLKVEVSTDKPDYRPGERVTAKIRVSDQNDKPIAAEVAIAAADEGVLSLIGYKTPNPIPTFYSPWGISVVSATQLAYVKDIPGPNVTRPATGGDSAGPGTLRWRFVSTAVWKPGIVTNSKGVATVNFTAPDNLTAFRIMAVAADRGHRFGSGDKRFTVSKPLQLHRVLPRFLTLGDTLDGGVVIHNETGAAGTATVALQTNNVLSIEGDKNRTVEVPAGGRTRVLFKMGADGLGEAELTFSVKLGDEKDRVRFTLPIHHPAPQKSHDVALGVTTKRHSIPVTLPEHALRGSAQVHVTVDPDGLVGIEDGLRDLIRYPYGCLEQTTSKVIPMIAVRELAESLSLEGLQGEDLNKFVKAGLAKIGRHQHSSGGFSLWPGGQPQAYYTGYALWGLLTAKQAGYPVSNNRIQDGLRYLRTQGKRPDKSKGFYNEAGNQAAQAFSLYIRALLGDKDTQAAIKLAENSEHMPIYGMAFLSRALAEGVGAKDAAVTKIVGQLGRLATQAANNNTLIDEPNGDKLRWYMSDSMRTTAIVLDALVALAPQHLAIKTLAKTLMAKRRETRYRSTQANLYSLLALTNYAKAVSAAAPNVTIVASGNALLTAELKGKNRISTASVPLTALKSPIVIEPRGAVHYAVTVQYRQKLETLKDISNTLSLNREYLDEDGKPKTSFQVGDIVVIRLRVPLTENKTHLMISDRIPAGFEALNTRLATVANRTTGNQRHNWGSHRELRDERADFSSEYIYQGMYERTYMARAIASGRFTVPPSVAELMYKPEQNAQTALAHIDIRAK